MPVRTTASVSMPASCMPSHVGEVEAVHPLHHQHATGHQRGVGSGDDEVALSELGERGGDVEHVLRLEAEVELLHDGLGEELDQRRGIGQRGDREAAHQMRGQPRHDGQVLADEPSDGRTLHLDHDLGPVDAAWRRAPGRWRRRPGVRGRRWRRRFRAVDPALPRSDLVEQRPTARVVTWSRHHLNSATSSDGKMPSPEETIWPSLI